MSECGSQEGQVSTATATLVGLHTIWGSVHSSLPVRVCWVSGAQRRHMKAPFGTALHISNRMMRRHPSFLLSSQSEFRLNPPVWLPVARHAMRRAGCLLVCEPTVTQHVWKWVQRASQRTMDESKLADVPLSFLVRGTQLHGP